MTGGTGTRWRDEHGGANTIYFEGGGILIQAASPTIQYNTIIDNKAIRVPEGIISAGGGGIRCGDGAPLTTRNVIKGNRGMYGGGIVMNYAGGVMTNNLIIGNEVRNYVLDAASYGGGGIWAYGVATTGLLTIQHNTIVENVALDTGFAPAAVL